MDFEHVYKGNTEGKLTVLKIPMRAYSGNRVKLPFFFATQRDYMCKWLKQSLQPIANHLTQIDSKAFTKICDERSPSVLKLAIEDIKHCLNEVIRDYPVKLSAQTRERLNELPEIRERVQHMDYKIKTTTEISDSKDMTAILHETLLAVLLLKEEVASERQAITEYIMTNPRYAPVLIECGPVAVITDAVTTPLEYLERAETALLILLNDIEDTTDPLYTASYTYYEPDDPAEDEDE